MLKSAKFIRGFNLLIFYSTAIFLSAFLIFLIQPVIGKMLLPYVGGSPAAWNSCMFFFQALMLAGYGFTHFSLKRAGIRSQAFILLAVAATTLFFLPPDLIVDTQIPENPIFWVLKKLFQTIALPFFLLAGLSPLLQVWFSKTTHDNSADPFFLYAASNAGSFFALLLYPIVIEPMLDLSHQAKLWMYLYYFLLVLLVFCRLFIKSSKIENDISCNETAEFKSIAKNTVSLWILAAFIPSSLLLSVTYFITSDIAPVPLLWIIPLLLYLATMSIAFSKYNPAEYRIDKLALFAVLVFPLSYFVKAGHFVLLSIPLNIFVLFSISLYCHSYLAKTRPSVKHLTSFYTFISLGGMLGGLFNSIISPLLFNSFIEYPLVIAASAFFIQKTAFSTENIQNNKFCRTSLAVAIMSAIVTAFALHGVAKISITDLYRKFALASAYNIDMEPFATILSLLRQSEGIITTLILVAIAVFPIALMRKWPAFSLTAFIGIAFLTMSAIEISESAPVIFKSRNYFGQKVVKLLNNGKKKTLTHGSTLHGMQSFSGNMRYKPLSYYHPLGPAGDIFELPQARKADARVAIIGLGIGSLAAYSTPGQEFTFIDIDPEIITIAAETDVLFSYISDNASQCRLICGDGRLKLAEEPDGKFDLIVIDAFSSDSIPVHLVTDDAVRLYMKKLNETGILAFNIANRYISLSSVLNAIAKNQQLAILTVIDKGFSRKLQENRFRDTTEYVVMSRAIGSIKSLLEIKNKVWHEPEEKHLTSLWTDSYSSILPLLKPIKIFK